MEYFLVHKSNFHKLFAQDEFFYPLVFNTPLLLSRYCGSQCKATLRGNNKAMEGIFLGACSEPLSKYLKDRLPKEVLSHSLAQGDSGHEWLEMNTRNAGNFDGVKYYSKPLSPPYRVIISDLGSYALLASASEAEIEEFSAGFNLVITNEAIEALTSLVKRRLPRVQKTMSNKKHAVSSPISPATDKGRQAHLRKFLGK